MAEPELSTIGLDTAKPCEAAQEVATTRAPGTGP